MNISVLSFIIIENWPACCKFVIYCISWYALTSTSMLNAQLFLICLLLCHYVLNSTCFFLGQLSWTTGVATQLSLCIAFKPITGVPFTTRSPLANWVKRVVKTSPEFFRFTRQLLKLSSKCEDHIFT